MRHKGQWGAGRQSRGERGGETLPPSKRIPTSPESLPYRQQRPLPVHGRILLPRHPPAPPTAATPSLPTKPPQAPPQFTVPSTIRTPYPRLFTNSDFILTTPHLISKWLKLVRCRLVMDRLMVSWMAKLTSISCSRCRWRNWTGIVAIAHHLPPVRARS